MVRKHGNRKAVRVVRAVYPGYIFARMDNQPYEQVIRLTCLPVRAWWVRFGGIVETVPGSVIRTIKQYEERNELVREEKYVNPYRVGVAVRVHHEMGELLGTVVKAVNGGRFLVDLQMGRAVVLGARLVVL